MNDRMLEKIRQLMQLADPSKAGSPEEAATAAKMAQKMMEKYRITETMLEQVTDKEQEEIERDILHSAAGVRLAFWKRMLGSALAKVNGCTTYTAKDRAARISKIMIVGGPSDASVVRYMYNYIAREIDRLTDEYAAARGNPGKSACNSFRMGAVEAIRERLYEAHDEAREEVRSEAESMGTSLVRVATAIAKLDKKQEDAKQWVESNVETRKAGTRYTLDKDAKRQGRRAGQNINLDKTDKKLARGSSGYLPSAGYSLCAFCAAPLSLEEEGRGVCDQCGQ